MDALTQIIHKLKNGEVRLVRNYYGAKTNGEERRRLQLFNLVKDKHVQSDEVAAKHIYGKKPDSAFSHLKNRLKNDLINLLLLQDSSKRYRSDIARAEFDCRRLMVAGDVLIGRGVDKMGIETLKKADKLAEKYELFSERVMVSNILRSYLGIQTGIDAYQHYNVIVQQAMTAQQKYMNAQDYYYRVVVPSLYHKNNQKKLEGIVHEALDVLRKDFEETRSAKIGYYYYIIAIYYYDLVRNYRKALDYSNKQLELITNSPAVNDRPRLASAHLQTASLNLLIESFDLAINNAESAVSLFKPGMNNHLLAIEILFFANYHAGNYKAATELIDTAFAHPRFNSNKVNPGKWTFFKANLLFMQQQYDECLGLLSAEDIDEIMKDRAGWQMGERLLEILCLFEQDDIDQVDYRIQNLRKLIARQKEKNIARIKLIQLLMESHLRNNLDAEITQAKEEDRLALLEKGEGDYHWDPMGYELVRFDRWLRKKAGASATQLAR